MRAREEIRNILIFFLIPLLLAGCVTVATQEELEDAKQELAENIKAVEGAIIDSLPLPIPKDATKELLGWISDAIIIGGGAGGAGVLARNKIKNGKKKATGTAT